MKIMIRLFFLVFVSTIGFLSCEKETTFEYLAFDPVPMDLSGMPSNNLHDIAIDRNHTFYFVTIHGDVEPPYAKSCLSRRVNEADNFEIVDDRFPLLGNVFFDRNNHLWCYTSKILYKIESGSHTKIIELPDILESGLFYCLAVDNDNTIWLGGLLTGLYKIDRNLHITHYNTENSDLPTNSLNNIHIDKNNNVWIALRENQGVLKISNDKWTIYNHQNSSITNQGIICLATDKNNHLWIGTGWDDENQSLMCFNGEKWETINPRNDKNEVVKGMVDNIHLGGSKLYIVSRQFVRYPEGGHAISNELLTFDGARWNKVYGFPENDSSNQIGRVIVDDYRKVVWVWFGNKGIFKLPY